MSSVLACWQIVWRCHLQAYINFCYCCSFIFRATVWILLRQMFIISALIDGAKGVQRWADAIKPNAENYTNGIFLPTLKLWIFFWTKKFAMPVKKLFVLLWVSRPLHVEKPCIFILTYTFQTLSFCSSV